MESVLVVLGLAAFGYVAVRVSKWQDQEANKGSAKIVCPHCQTQGSVTIKMLTRGKGISGGKATGALFTGGASMLATGLSKNVPTRHLTCGNCAMEWDVA